MEGDDADRKKPTGQTPMKIHAEIKTPVATYLISESAGSGGGREFGNFVMLRIVRVAAGSDYKSVRSKGVEVIEQYEADSRHTGPRSHYRLALNTLLSSLPKSVRVKDALLAA
jgi:hypothetical protein